TYSHRALALTDLARHADAASDWGRFVLVAPPQYRLFGRVRRADSLARAGQREQAMKEADAVARLAKLPALFLYHLACVASLCAASDPGQPLPRSEHLTEVRARRAIAWLQAARQAGFFKAGANVAHLKKDANLDTLRHRTDFRMFLGQLTP